MTDANEPDLAALREKYIGLREAQRRLNNRLPTMLPKPAYKECGQRLGFWKDGVLVFDSEDHLAVFTDYAIYDYRLRGTTNAVERLWKLGENKPGSLEHEVLKAMLDARFTVIRVVEVVPGTGATVDDLLYGERRFLADLRASENSEPGLTIATRLLSFPEFVMTSGTGFPVGSKGADDLIRRLGGGSPESLADDMRKFGVAGRSKMAATLIRSVLGARRPREE
jgi:hypothetical protein